MNQRIVVSIVIILSMSLAIYLIIEYGVKKWKCVEGTCEKVIGGDFSSLEKCKSQCQRYKSTHHRRMITGRRERAHEKKKQVNWSPELVQYAPE